MFSLYKIMFMVPVMKDHLSWETVTFNGHFLEVLCDDSLITENDYFPLLESI